jgi:CubicO group peptidase (beta-lactamase class C family)
MRVPDIKFHLARYFIVSLFLPFFALGGLGWAATSTKPFAIDKLKGGKESEYRLDQEKISEAVRKIESEEFGKIHSLIIIQNDEVKIEKYFQGWHRHRLHEIFSVTKSVASSLIGIAIEQGLIEGVDLKLIDLFPEYDRLENMDPRKKMITLENLLTMTAGYKWNELSVPYKNNDGSWNPNNDIIKMHINSNNFIKYVLDLPLKDDPGKIYNYNSGCSILLAGIIARKTRKSAEEYAAEYLFKPLGITQWKWLKSPEGTTDTGGGLSLHPADMAMFGYLYLKNGKVNGQQIVSEIWVNRSTKGYVSTKTGEYGYQWWRFKKSSGKPNSEIINTSYYAVGIGNQTIFVMPKANMVVVSTADNLLHKGKNIYDLFFELIIPALKLKEGPGK